jgi:hypothetical protein
VRRLYWLTPESWQNKIVKTEFNGGMEMFVLSGIMIVTAFTSDRLQRPLLTVLTAGSRRRRREPRAAHPRGRGAGVGAGRLPDGRTAGGLGQLFTCSRPCCCWRRCWRCRGPLQPRARLKMGVAYLLAPLRTGMTIAMFSLIMFSPVMSIINASFLDLFAEEAKGG